jgi:hypothetical protein
MAASRAHVVRQLQFAAVRTFLKLGGLQRVMAAAHVPLGRRSFSLWDSHCGTFECRSDNNKNCDDLRLISAVCPVGQHPQAAAGSSRTAAPIAKVAVVASLACQCEESDRGGQLMVPVPVTLVTTAAAVFVNMWLGWRISQLRHRLKVSVGDGGQEPLLRRMRAQANFIENVPFFLILLCGLELSGANRIALGIIAAVFILARIAHGVGMDGGDAQVWRRIGMPLTALTSVLLSVWALVCAFAL